MIIPSRQCKIQINNGLQVTARLLKQEATVIWQRLHRMHQVKSRSRDPDVDPHMTYCCIVFVRACQPSIGTLNFRCSGDTRRVPKFITRFGDPAPELEESEQSVQVGLHIGLWCSGLVNDQRSCCHHGCRDGCQCVPSAEMLS